MEIIIFYTFIGYIIYLCLNVLYTLKMNNIHYKRTKEKYDNVKINRLIGQGLDYESAYNMVNDYNNNNIP